MEKSSHNGAGSLSAEGEVGILTGSARRASREILSLEVECGSCAPAVVRRALSRISELGATRDDVILVASELVTNAVVHSGASVRDTLDVRAQLGRGWVLISVRDPGLSGDSPRVRASEGLQAHGSGLRIINEVAQRWGFERDHGCLTWAELRLSPARVADDSGPV